MPPFSSASRSSRLRFCHVLIALLVVTGCDDDSPAPATSVIGNTGTGVTNSDGVGTVLPASTDPDATDAPNPNAGGAGTGGSTP